MNEAPSGSYSECINENNFEKSNNDFVIDFILATKPLAIVHVYFKSGPRASFPPLKCPRRLVEDFILEWRLCRCTNAASYKVATVTM